MSYLASDQRSRAIGVLQEVVKSIDHLSGPVVRRMGPVLHQAQAELQGQLRDWLGTQGGEARFTTQRYRNALVAVRHARKALEVLDHTTESALWESAEKAGPLATHHLEQELVRFGHIFDGTIQPVALDQAAIIARGDDLLIDRFASSAARYAGSVRDTVIQELAVSRVKSETMFELTNRLERRLPQVFVGQRHAAERLARTETMHSYSVYAMEGLKEANRDDSEIVARWDASFDSRRCPACASLDGQVRNVAKGEKFEARWVSKARKGGIRIHAYAVEHPPAHPSCRCVLTPWREDWPDYSRPRTPAAPEAQTLS